MLLSKFISCYSDYSTIFSGFLRFLSIGTVAVDISLHYGL
jgi:hypothetical protein